MLRDFSNVKRLVVKVGTNILTKNGGVDTAFMGEVARQLAQMVRQKRQVILVTSGAIGMGRTALGLEKKITEVKLRQACAAVGQGILMNEYEQAFAPFGQKVAQVLLTNRIMSHRRYYVNLKNAMETLLSMGIVPIVNENDCVSIDEIGLAFGDNDTLSALVASKIDAELLLILTDVAGLYDRNPRLDPAANLIPVVYELTPEIEAMAGAAGSSLGTGGMKTKLSAIRIAAHSGCRVILADGRQENVIPRLLAGEEIGTLFLPKRRLSNRKRWILNSHSEGVIEVDAGAAAALRNSRSLLAVGVTKVRGHFEAGEVVKIGEFAKGVASLSSEELRRLLAEREKADSGVRPRAIVHANDLVLLNA